MEEKSKLDLNKVDVGVEIDNLTDLQIYGISKTVVTLMGLLKKYIILTQIQKDLQSKSHQIQPIMREFYQFEETKMIMDIRTQLDMAYVYSSDKTIINNFQLIRDAFENAISFLTYNMQQVTSILDNNYTEILDEFSNKLKIISDAISKRSIYNEQFNIL